MKFVMIETNTFALVASVLVMVACHSRSQMSGGFRGTHVKTLIERFIRSDKHKVFRFRRGPKRSRSRRMLRCREKCWTKRELPFYGRHGHHHFAGWTLFELNWPKSSWSLSRLYRYGALVMLKEEESLVYRASRRAGKNCFPGTT